MTASNPKDLPALPPVLAVQLAQALAAQSKFLSRGRDALEHMERTGISYSVEELSALLTAKIEAKRAELLKRVR